MGAVLHGWGGGAITAFGCAIVWSQDRIMCAVLHGWGEGAITASHGVSVTRSLQASARGERLPLSSPELVCHLALNDWCHHYS